MFDIIASVKLEVLKKANEIARGLGQIDLRDYALKNPEKLSPELLRLVLEQYSFIQKLSQKVPSWHRNPEILGASLVNIAQSTSEDVARWKFHKLSTRHTADLTGGFGIDSFFLSNSSENHVLCEVNTELLEVVRHNFGLLGKTNVTFRNESAEEFIHNTTQQFDLIYLDPDRRSSVTNKLVRIEDCSPDLTQIHEQLRNLAPEIWVKYSPLLDISRALTQLPGVFEVMIIAVKNDVKELLFKLGNGVLPENPMIRAVNITGPHAVREFSFHLNEEKESTAQTGPVSNYLYEPNNAVLKSGAFNLLAKKFGLTKMAVNSHFYSSEHVISDFPGRVFHISDVFSPAEKNLKPFRNTGWNIIARNYPLNPETICRKYRLKEGGKDYLIFTTDQNNNKIVLNCTKIPDYD